MQKIQVKAGAKFEDYKAYASLTHTVQEFLQNVRPAVDRLKGSTIWMINSTSLGGGVAEMLPSQMRLIRELGLKIEWLVIETDNAQFFNLTKRIHNAIHGAGDGVFREEEREVFEQVNKENLEQALDMIQDGDFVVIHDPQPLPLAKFISEKKEVKLIWRCHIGLDRQNDCSRSVWAFLFPYFTYYDHFVFSLVEYVPEILKDKTTIICPAIDPLSHKNRILPLQKLVGILNLSGILQDKEPPLFEKYSHQVRRILPNGDLGEVNADSELDLIYRPLVTQISRWDRLKGFKELMEAFIRLKQLAEESEELDDFNKKRIKVSRLVLGGPDPKFVSDDPEGKQVLDELIAQYQQISPELQEDIALLMLPMDNPKENALIVNALQNASTIVVQNSLEEGFGLTATEAMWKEKAILVSGALGLAFQVDDRKNGRINHNPKDIEALARVMAEMLSHPLECGKLGFNGQLKVIEHFTLFSQIHQWLTLLSNISVSVQQLGQNTYH